MGWRTKLCAESGCGKVAEQGVDFCADHRENNSRQVARAASDKRSRAARPWAGWYGLAIWRDLKSVFLGSDGGDHTVCEYRDPRTGERCPKPTAEVDHKIPHCGNWSLFTSKENLQGLCGHHHAEKTAKENGGFRNAKHS